MKKKKKIVPKLRQEVKVKVEIVSSDDIKIYYTGKFQVYNKKKQVTTICKYQDVEVNSIKAQKPDPRYKKNQKSVRTISRSLKYQRRTKEKNIMQISICEGEDHKSKNNRREKERGRERKI